MASRGKLVQPYEVYRLVSECGLVYVGCSWGRTAEQRWACHLRAATRGAHCGSPLVAEKIRAGVVFILEVLEVGEADRDSAYRREEHFIGVELERCFDAVLNRNLQPTKPGFNPTHPETRAKMRASATRRWKDPDQHERASRAAVKRSNHPEHLRRMRESNPVKFLTPEKRAEITRKITGKKRTIEARERYSQASRTRWAEASREPINCACGAGPFRGPRALATHRGRKHKESDARS